MLTTFLQLIRPATKAKNSLTCLFHPIIFKRRLSTIKNEDPLFKGSPSILEHKDKGIFENEEKNIPTIEDEEKAMLSILEDKTAFENEDSVQFEDEDRGEDRGEDKDKEEYDFLSEEEEFTFDVATPSMKHFNSSEVEKYRKKAGNIDDKLYHSDIYAKMAEMEMANVIRPTAKEAPQVKKSCELCKLIGRKAHIDAMVKLFKN